MSDNEAFKPLWRGSALIEALGARAPGLVPDVVSGVSIDTRTLSQGDLFIAIKGDSDGHAHVETAFQNGAAAAVVDENGAVSRTLSGPLLVVVDTLQAMENMARAARARAQAKIVAVTGSVGKTSTKEALRAALSDSGMTHASAASYNNHWGVPLTLARLHEQARYGVFEIGMNHAGEVTPLTGMVKPHVAIITTIAPVHMEFFDSLDAIADAKAEIFSGLLPGGIAILPGDVPQFERLRRAALASAAGHAASFGEAAGHDARLISCIRDGEGSRVEAEVLGIRVSYRLGAPGRHLAVNSLAVLLAVQAIGADMDGALRALEKLTQPAGRGARESLDAGNGQATLIDESYNANPASMRAALALLHETIPSGSGRRIAVLGDMLELGADSPQFHRDLASSIEACAVDLVFCAGPQMRHLYDALPSGVRGHWAASSRDMEDAVVTAIGAGDVVMVKGSNGSRMAPVVAAIRKRFSSAAAQPSARN